MLFNKKVCTPKFQQHVFIGLIFLSLILSCKPETEFSSITKANFYEKLTEAYIEVSVNHKYELSNDIQFFVETKAFKIKGAHELGKYNYLLSLNYYNLNQYEEASIYIKKAIAFFEKTPNPQKELSFCYIELANIAYVNSNASTFEEYAKQAEELVDEESCPNCLIDLYFSRAIFYIIHEDFEKCKAYSLKAIQLINKNNTKLKLAKYFYTYAARSDIKLKNYDTAKEHLQNALNNSLETDYGVKEAIHFLYGTIYTHSKEFEKAILSFERGTKIRKDLYLKNIESQKDKMVTSLSLTKEIDSQKKRIINQQKALLAMTICLLCLSFVFVYWVLRQKKHLRTKADQITALNLKLQNTIIDVETINQNLTEKTKKIDSLLQTNSRTLFSKELQLSTMRDSLKKISSRVSEVMNLNSIAPNQLSGIEKKILDLISDENAVWEDYKIQFEQIRPGFFKKIHGMFPDLTINELKHCSYILSNLSNKDVATIVNVSPRSVETARYRIKKKLKTTDNLYEFLQKI